MSEVRTPAFPVGSDIIEVPSISHHQFEVSVIVDGHTYVVVVFEELIE